MSAVVSEEELAAACRQTLRQWPGARAAVLFGSRARGTAHPNSDWDVAIVLEGDELRHPRPARSVFPRSELPADLPHVEVWALSEEDLRRNARALGTLPYAVCRDGRVLAGEWNRPESAQMKREAAMNPEDWAGRMRQAVTTLSFAIASVSRIAERPLWAGSGEDCSHLLRNTADAAELLVKAAMERRGVPADLSHDIARLAGAFAAQRPEESELAERMAALNGTSRTDHMAMYRFSPPDVADVQAAVMRLAGTLDLWAFEIEEREDGMAGQIPELARVAAFDMAAWSDHVSTPVTPKADESHPARAAAEAALEGRAILADAVASFRDRMRGLTGGENSPDL